jgi:hypothetical protein
MEPEAEVIVLKFILTEVAPAEAVLKATAMLPAPLVCMLYSMTVD